MDRAEHCWTCGRPRGLSQQRESWSLRMPTPAIPRTGNPADKPSQGYNDLICQVSVYRNGGTDRGTHLCDDCLRIGVRAIKVRIDELLEELGEEHDKDKALAELTERLATSQFRHRQVCFDHNRMQKRLKEILPPLQDNEPEALRDARWEANRDPAKANRA